MSRFNQLFESINTQIKAELDHRAQFEYHTKEYQESVEREMKLLRQKKALLESMEYKLN